MGGMSLFRDDGIVLRTQKLGEADRIISLLTRNNGRVRAVARGCGGRSRSSGRGSNRSATLTCSSSRAVVAS
ncbi:hypothetical protein SSPO_066390 [Streptomyces antimycoticus]|nr:hypothetical protein SSPO_066390 [Streptomyces antimycoticus]